MNDPMKVSICAASGRGSWEDIVSLLMQGVDVNSQHVIIDGVEGGKELVPWRDLIFWGFKRDGSDDNARRVENVRHELSTPLIAACAHNRVDIVVNLLKHPNIDVNLPNSKGQTPLMYAAAVGNMDLILPLLKADADREGVDAKGRNAEDWALSKGKEWASWVIKTDPEKISVVGAAMGSNPKVLQALIAQGCSVVARSGGQTALIAAAKCGHVEVLDVLLEQASKEEGGRSDFIEAEDDNSETALIASSRLDGDSREATSQ